LAKIVFWARDTTGSHGVIKFGTDGVVAHNKKKKKKKKTQTSISKYMYPKNNKNNKNNNKLTTCGTISRPVQSGRCCHPGNG
tara:strand:+ start:76 stop:321 length:246 start_codon:yes stop_codon:yes gene_type:complete